MKRLRWLAPDDPPDAFPPLHEALDEPAGPARRRGDLSPERLLAAYARGISPWYAPGQPILWWSPDPRGDAVPGRVPLLAQPRSHAAVRRLPRHARQGLRRGRRRLRRAAGRTAKHMDHARDAVGLRRAAQARASGQLRDLGRRGATWSAASTACVRAAFSAVNRYSAARRMPPRPPSRGWSRICPPRDPADRLPDALRPPAHPGQPPPALGRNSWRYCALALSLLA